MKIVVNVPKVAKKVGIFRANQLGVRAKISPGVAAKWWRGNLERIELSVLERICDLCKCEFTEILSATNGSVEVSIIDPVPGDVDLGPAGAENETKSIITAT